MSTTTAAGKRTYVYVAAAWLVVLAILTCAAAASIQSASTQPQPESQTHIAFLFGGSARSLVYPIVHRTIRHNLIHAFCPHTLRCVPHVFARISLSDNRHQEAGFDARGKFSQGDQTLRTAVGTFVLATWTA
jgi:hypothetical protein